METLTQPLRPASRGIMALLHSGQRLCPTNSGGIVRLGTGLGLGQGAGFGTDIRAGK